MNVDLLRKVADAIIVYPAYFDMGSWVNGTGCGTTLCIAGWAAFLSQTEVRPEQLQELYAVSSHAACGAPQECLLLDGGEEDRLCYVADWPVEFRGSYEAADERGDQIGMAHAGYERIQHFIATDGRE